MNVAIIVLVLVSLQLLMHSWSNRVTVARGIPPSFVLQRGGVIGVASTLVFGLVAGLLIWNHAFQRFESALGARLHRHDPVIGRLIEILASPDYILVIVIGLCLALILARYFLWKELVLWLTTLGSGLVVLTLMKTLLQRPRPSDVDSLGLHIWWEFPSGHAMGAMIFFGLVAFIASQHLSGRWRSLAVVVSALAILFFGFGRLYSGVHYLSDVLAGYAAGLSWLVLCLSAYTVLSIVIPALNARDLRAQRKV